MDAHQIATAEACLKASYNGTMSFPEIVGALHKAGFEGYTVDYRRNTTTYFLPHGDSVVLVDPATSDAVAECFDQASVMAQIKWAQSGSPDYWYPAFKTKVKAAGCAGYIVSFLGRRVLYFGRTAETHVELLPQ